eukprot:13445862-Alexandrium_andersonii.AAC.1
MAVHDAVCVGGRCSGSAMLFCHTQAARCGCVLYVDARLQAAHRAHAPLQWLHTHVARCCVLQAASVQCCATHARPHLAHSGAPTAVPRKSVRAYVRARVPACAR